MSNTQAHLDSATQATCDVQWKEAVEFILSLPSPKFFLTLGITLVDWPTVLNKYTAEKSRRIAAHRAEFNINGGGAKSRWTNEFELVVLLLSRHRAYRTYDIVLFFRNPLVTAAVVDGVLGNAMKDLDVALKGEN